MIDETAPTSGKAVLITGGTDGIGKATAQKLLAAGWEVVIVGRSASRCVSTVEELKTATGHPAISSIVADLSLLAEARRACDEFLAEHQSLDFLFLNANAISQKRTLTAEGFESNLALGYLSRALLAQALEGALATASRAQVLAVVGLNKERLDFDDLTMEREFSGMKALGRWQWAMQVYAREFNARSPVPMNIYMPGIVKTKILDSEPSLIARTMIKAVYAVKAASVEDSAGYVLGVMNDVEENRRRDCYYSVKTLKPRRDLGELASDQQDLWVLTEGLLMPYLSGDE